MNGPFAASGHMVQNPPYWRASCPLGHPEQSDFIKTNLHFLCFGCPSAQCSPLFSAQQVKQIFKPVKQFVES